MSAIEIRHCPFCGKAGELQFNQRVAAYYVRCSSCRCRTRMDEIKERAVMAWNRRDDGTVHGGT